jgi:signal peptidase I
MSRVVRALLAAGPVLYIIDTFVSVAPVHGSSMKPTLNERAEREWILANRLRGRRHRFERGEVAVFK